MEQLLRMEDICKSFSEVRVLNKIKLELRQGKSTHCWVRTVLANPP